MDVHAMAWYRALHRHPGPRALRVLVLTLLILAAADIALAVAAPPLPVPERFHDEYLPDAATFLAAVHREPGTTTVLVLGDSVFYGPGIANASETIPQLYARALAERSGQRVRIHNFALPGATLQDQYLLMKNAISNADMVVFQVSPLDALDRRSARPGLAYLPAVTPEEARDVLSQQPYSALLHGFLRLAQHWQLYRSRFLFRAPFLYLPKESEPPSSPLHYPGPMPLLPENSSNIRYARKIASLARESHVPVFAVLAPLNPAVRTNFTGNETSRHESLSRIARALEPAVLLEYDQIELGQDDYFDSMHLKPAGARALAERLAQDTAPRRH